MFLGGTFPLILVLFSAATAQLFDDMPYSELDFASSYFNDDTDPYEQDFSESDSLEEDDEDYKEGWTVVSEDEVADIVGRIEATERHEQFAMDADHHSTIVTVTTEELGAVTAEDLENVGEETEEKSTTTPLQSVTSLFSHLFSTTPATDDEILEAATVDAIEPEIQNAEGTNLNAEIEFPNAEELAESSTVEGETVKLKSETSKPEEVIEESERKTPKVASPTVKTEQKSLELDKGTSDTETAATKSVEEITNIESAETKLIEIAVEPDGEVENVDEKSVEMESKPLKLEELSLAMEIKTTQLLEEMAKTERTFPVETIVTDAPYSTEEVQEVESRILKAEGGKFSLLKTEVPSMKKETENVKTGASASEEINSESNTKYPEIVEPKQKGETKFMKSEETRPVPEVAKTEEARKIWAPEETDKEVQKRELTLEPTLGKTLATEVLKSEESREPVQEDLIVPAKAIRVNKTEFATQTQITEENTQSLQQEEVSLETTEELSATSAKSL